MLRITIHDEPAAWRMQLEGKLAGDYAPQAEDAWRSAPAGRPVEIDLTGVTLVDEAGLALLKTMKLAGARFRSKGVAMKALVGGTSACGWVRHLFAVLLLAFGCALTLHAQEASPAAWRLTLQQAVDLALRQNPQVITSNLDLAESQQNGLAARSALLPQASFDASQSAVRENIEGLLGRRVSIFPGHAGPFWIVEAGGSASLPLFDLTLWRRWQAARQNVQTAKAEQTSARELNAQLVVSQYLGALRAAADVEAAASRLALAKALYDLAGDLQKNGVGTSIDTLRAHVEYQNEVQRSAQARAQWNIALYGLGRLLDLDPRQAIELADRPSFFETPAVSADEDLARAWRNRPELQSVLSRERAADFEKRAARDQSLPQLSLAGGWNLQGTAPSNMIPVYEVGASLHIPLFTGGRIQAETAVQDLELKKLAQAERDIRNQIALEVKSALTDLDAARVEVEAANEGVDLARESVRQARDRFRAGVANNIEVITAQDELARANDNQIAALYQYNQSRADLARATGRMEELYAQ